MQCRATARCLPNHFMNQSGRQLLRASGLVNKLKASGGETEENKRAHNLAIVSGLHYAFWESDIEYNICRLTDDMD